MDVINVDAVAATDDTAYADAVAVAFVVAVVAFL